MTATGNAVELDAKILIPNSPSSIQCPYSWYVMPSEFVDALNQLIEAIDTFLESGLQSGAGENDDPPNRDMVVAGGQLHNAVKAVESFFKNKKLPAPDARNPWIKLCRARDKTKSEFKWQTKSHKHANKLKKWAEFSAENAMLDDLVTLDQVAPLTGLSKRTLERHLKEGEFPEPDTRGGGGKSHKWLWNNIRPSLEKISNRVLPVKFPGSRIL